jgi:alkanesulfonate monooxygenase SsuD/methylene tetrahydromethanopterin reductase-like flavin-dependent oxidoreductase (luciferase family)
VTARRRGVAFTPMETRRDVIVRAARRADELGYETVSLPEGWGLDSTPVLTEIALRTRQIRLASGVLSVWGRTPATLAMTAATLHQISGGRFVLGLGASTRALVEGFHDTAFEHPAAKLRDTVTKVRALLAGEPAHLDRVPGARPLRLGQPPAPELPIWLAAMGDHTLRVAAELGDGWFPVMVTRAQAFTVAAGPMTVVDDDSRTARGIAASCTAWYVGAMGDVYARFVSEQGYGDEVRAILAANPRPSPRRGVVPAEAQVVLDQLAAYGAPGQVRDRLELWDGVVDVVMVGLPPGLSWQSIEATLRTAAP